MGVDAVLFDMDGTLVDSDAVVERVWRAWARENEVDEDLVLTTMPGRPAADTVRAVRPDLDAEAHGRAQLAQEYRDLDGVVAAPGAHDLLAALDHAGTPWAVVTSADDRLARLRLGAAGITPRTLVTRDLLTHGKPHPEGYLHAAEVLGVDPTRCLVVEDTVTGADAGRAAGARVAGLKGIDADLPITSLTDLLELTR
ncbi:HAD family hydrolase [Actinomycetospora corticicola]|uniref:Sugar-phosphatase n=1 Tax=Actinomycetospora corticicola TaxID=663602 RepID=A0A7Y9J5R2_9PSEU|nr:HAD-IA family hydrolase [Actinomycetospora corticicola]NYD36430.1 sugar-phosphatase [Actinomycetospora corticicola]